MQEVLSTAHVGDALRARIGRLVLAAPFQRAVAGLIVLNALVLGLETSAAVMATMGGLLHAIDLLLLLAFTAELALRIYAFRGAFFRDPWGLFDLVVVAIAWVPASDGLSVLRALRVLRVLRLLSVVPSLRVVVEAMLGALPGMGSIVLLMLLLFYVFAVMATKLYADIDPEHFGTIGDSLFTLFQLMTLDDWANVIAPATAAQPWALLFFMPFILVATFVVLNLFIGVIVDSIQTLRAGRDDAVAAGRAALEDARDAALLAELRALRAEVAALAAQRGAAPAWPVAGRGTRESS